MDSEAFKVLEYEKIKDRLASFASSMRGKELCRTMTPAPDFDTVLRLHAETAEAVSVLQMQSPPFGGIYDLRRTLQKATLGSILEVEELREIMSTMQGMRNVKYFFRDAELPLLKEKSVRIEILGMLEKHLQNTIDEHGNFRDDASPELRRVTREMLSAQNRVKERLSAILHDAAYQKCFQDAIVTVRAERYVIPVKQEYRAQFPGVIHDRSASGATLFVEPLATVELNNSVKWNSRESRKYGVFCSSYRRKLHAPQIFYPKTARYWQTLISFLRAPDYPAIWKPMRRRSIVPDTFDCKGRGIHCSRKTASSPSILNWDEIFPCC